MNRLTLLLPVCTLLAGCATEQVATVNEYLDPETAYTIRAVAEPVLYARDAPELAANVRDYLSAGVVEVNNMGKRSHYLGLIAWSTIDRKRPGAEPAAIPDRIEITIDGHARELSPATRDPHTIGIGLPLFRPETGYSGEAWYAISTRDIHALVATRSATIELLEGPGRRLSFALWQDAGEALADFVRDMPDPISSQSRSH